MNKRFSAFSVFTAMLLAAFCLAGTALAQDDAQASKPMFKALPPHYSSNAAAPTTALQTWNGTFTYKGKSNAFTMVGTDPSSTNVSTTIPVFIIPIRLGYKLSSGNKIFDPAHKLSNGQTVIQNVLASPIFNSGIDFVQGGTDLGNTQYIDAYQRGNFWTNVMTNTNYHVLLGTPTVLTPQTLIVPASKGSVTTEFGVQVGTADITWFDQQINKIITKFTQIQPNALPIFVTYDSYLTQGGCCIGGYHSATGSSSAPQSYAHFTYIDHAGVFSQDVSALSHEVGEWMDDPFTNNVQGACGGILENGDPLEGEPNYGGFPYTLNGFQYNLQDLVFLQYFGQTPSTSVNGWWSFQNANLSVCSNGQ